MNVFDYLKWRGDIPFDELNEIDVLIFNRLSYFSLEKIMTPTESLTIEEAYQRGIQLSYNKNDQLLFEQISKNNRYKNMVISKVLNIYDKAKEEQFLALCIDVSKSCLYVSFRGTNGTLIGWKEDFNMAFMNPIPAQEDALKYVNDLKTFKKIYLGGHSKGGNLAIYAGINANKNIKYKIKKIFNYDGPGFMNLSNKYYIMKDKIITYIPGDSVIGRLMNTDNETIVIKSNAKGIIQHDLYSWQLERKTFIRDTLSKNSDTIKKIMAEWADKMAQNERKTFVNDIYEMIKSTGVERIKDLKISDLKKMVLSYKKMDDESKKVLFTIMGYLVSSTKDNINKKRKLN